MTTPKPDLDLRLAVARAVYPEADLWIDTDMQKVMGEHYGEFDSRGHVEPYDLSFDAILPLFRSVPNNIEALHKIAPSFNHWKDGFDRLVLIVQWNATRRPRCGKLTKLEPIKEETA